MKRTTLKDIAEIAGVNPSTVSRALKDHPDISVAIKNEIRNIAENLKYHPNQFAANLRKQRSNFIALIIPEITMFFFPSVIRGIEEVVKNEGYQLMVIQSNDSCAIEKMNIVHCFDQSVDGILISLSSQNTDINHLIEAKEMGIPVVIFDKTLDNNVLDEVIIDDIKATETCIEHLLIKGKTKIAGIFGHRNLTITQKRVEGFVSTLTKHKIEFCLHYADSLEEGKKIVGQLIHSFNPDAIFAMSDELIAASFSALTEKNIDIPGQCALIGMSDGMLPQILNPKITFLHHNGFLEGSISAKKLIERIKMHDFDYRKEKIVIETKLVVQQST